MTGYQTFFRSVNSTILAGSVCLGLISCQPAVKTWPRFTLETGGANLTSIEMVDLNGDRIPELIAAGPDLETLLIYQRSIDETEGVRWQRTDFPVPGGVLKTRFWQPLVGEARRSFLIVLSPRPESPAALFPVESGEGAEIRLGDPIALPLPPARWQQVTYGDLNNDGVEDLAFAAGVDNEDLAGAPIAVWVSQPTTPDSPAERITMIIGKVGQALLLLAEDIDRDGDIDLKVIDGNTANESMGAYWLENPWPDQPGVEWKRRFITLSAAPPAHGHVVDLDGDARNDLLLPFKTAEGSNRLVGFKKIVKGGQTGWLPLPYPISGKQGRIRESRCADLNLNGSVDIVLGFEKSDAPLEHLFWMENPGESTSPTWIRRPISGPHGSNVRDMLIRDIDQDGDPDILVIENDGELVWYQNPHFPIRE